MLSRTARTLLVLVVGGSVLGATACSGPVTHDAHGTRDTHDTHEQAVLTRAQASSVVVADTDSATDRAVRTSRALFASAPGAVVTTPGAVARAATVAARLHVPTLVTDGSDAAGTAVATELDRLGADWWVGAGDVTVTGTDARRTDVDDVPSVTEPSRASRPATVVVTDPSADAAAVATARTARATIVTMPDGVHDPAASGDTIDALAQHRADPTVLVGAAFAELPDATWSVRAAENGYQLPGGGQRPFDGHRYVALYGAPGAPSLGVLGEQDPTATVQRAKDVAAQYDGLSDVPISPALEVIGTVAAGDPGADGDYSNELPETALEPYLDAAHQAGMPVILDLQPGRTDFLTQAKQYESLLSRPDVWLALDPEWRLAPDQVPLRQIGSVSAAEVNSVSDWLAGLIEQKGLPPKAFVLHQFRLSMIQDRASLTTHPELDMLVHVDGQGSQPDKQATWNALHVGAPASMHWGWKNFYDEDQPMLTPEQTMADVQPTPSLITYQ